MEVMSVLIYKDIISPWNQLYVVEIMSKLLWGVSWNWLGFLF